MNPNREEQLVIDNLLHQGYSSIDFEPDGNVPPDILVDNKIAIEVRRLNQNQITNEGYKGLEQDEFTIHGILRRIMHDVSDKDYDLSAFVCYNFNRPIPSKKVIKKKVSEILENHKSIIHEIREYIVDESFKMKILPSEKKLDQQYKYGMSSDEDTGGFVVSLIYENLKLIVAEKDEKTKKFRQNYPEWWLAVVDNIGYGLSDLDLEQFHNLPKIENNFDRLLLVSALDSKSFRYLYE